MSRAERVIFNKYVYGLRWGPHLVQNKVNDDWRASAFQVCWTSWVPLLSNQWYGKSREEAGPTIYMSLALVWCQAVLYWKKIRRYIVFLYKTSQSFWGELITHPKEGEVFWIDRKDLDRYSLAVSFGEVYRSYFVRFDGAVYLFRGWRGLSKIYTKKEQAIGGSSTFLPWRI